MKRSAFIRVIRGAVLGLLLVALAAAPAAATVTVTGHVKIGDTTTPGANVVRVRFELIRCTVAGQNTPRVIGVTNFNPKFDVTTFDGTGAFSVTTYGNDVITCDQAGNSRWKVTQIFSDGTSQFNVYQFTDGVAANLDSLATDNSAAVAYQPNAVVTNPSGAQTGAQPAGTRLSWSGVDFGAGPSAPAQRGTSLPATCSIGDEYFKTDATAGQNKYGCTATNTWSLQGGAGSLTSVFGRTGAVVSANNDYNFNQIAGTLTSNQLPATNPLAIQKGNSSGGTQDSAAIDNLSNIKAYGFNMSNPGDLNTVWLRDDFITGVTGNTWGELRWTFSNIGAGPSITNVASDGSEIGIVTMTSTAVSGQGGSLWLAGVGSIAPTPLNAIVFDSQFRFKLPVTSNISVNVGFNGGSVNTLNAGNSFFLRYDTASADTNFMYVVGANAAVSSGIPVDTNWHTLRIRATVAGTIKFSIDGGSETSFSSGIPTNGQFPLWLVVTQTTATKTLNIGAWSFIAYNQARSL